MPKNLNKLFDEPYLDSVTGKSGYYNRIIIGAYKGGKKGVVWITGINKKEKILDFVYTILKIKILKIIFYIPFQKDLNFKNGKEEKN